MATDQDWRPLVSASDRFDNIQRIKDSLEASDPEAQATAQSNAFALENRAYQESKSRAQYDEVCRVVGMAAPALVQRPGHDQPELTTTIGPYPDCVEIASGVTSEVYRSSGTKALKVIVETRNIEPHNPHREAKILADLRGRPNIIPLLETFRDQEQRFVLVFPYMPLTLANLLDQGPVSMTRVKQIFRDIFAALADIHAQGIIHRDIKPSAILLESPSGMSDGDGEGHGHGPNAVYLSDFGTAWHPSYSSVSETPGAKVLDIGTGPYRAPECMFGDKSYGTAVDMWAAGTMLAEACRRPTPVTLFESRPAHEDGSQLGLILSIFKSLGTPTPETWPEAMHFKTPPFEMYQRIDGLSWDDILPDVQGDFRDLIARLVRFGSKRATAQEALRHECLVNGHD